MDFDLDEVAIAWRDKGAARARLLDPAAGLLAVALSVGGRRTTRYSGGKW